MPLLEVKSLRTYFHAEHGLVKAVDDVSFRIEEGRTLGIVGESGSGKSVTSFSIMRLLAGAGVIEPGSKIALLGKDLVGLPEPQMRQVRGKDISMIFQEPMTSLNPVFTIGNQLVEAISLQHHDGRRGLVRRAVDGLKRVRVAAPFGIAGAIITEAGLSLLGFGVQPPAPSWGTLLKQGNDNYSYWWLILIPSIAIFVCVTLFNLVGNGLRDAMDPRLRA